MLLSVRTKTTYLGYTQDDHKCFHCDAIGRQPLFKTVERPLIFFIPLPFKLTEYFLVCLVHDCKGVTKLNKKQVDLMYITQVESGI